MNPIDWLSENLNSLLIIKPKELEEWTDNNLTKNLIKNIREKHDPMGNPPDPITIQMSVEYFRKMGKPDGWRGLKRACFGVAFKDSKEWNILSDTNLLQTLLTFAEEVDTHKEVRCYQALLSSYWRCPRPQDGSQSLYGWLTLRSWLYKRIISIHKRIGNTYFWTEVINEHKNLLLDHPCDRYGPKLLEGDSSEFQSVITGIGIPLDSWVQEEAVMAQIKAGTCRKDHPSFLEVLPYLISISTKKDDVVRSKTLHAKCVAALISRYAQIPGTPENTVLRDAAVTFIGNPWLRKELWDIFVVDEKGNPDDKAREMVNGWIKRQLIKDFFDLLSDDRAGDVRRLEYWLRFEPFISDMWFILGSKSFEHPGEGYKDFRKRADGRLLKLDGSTPRNNAFIMRIGEFAAVEFSEKGNALYLIRWSDLPTKLLTRTSSHFVFVNIGQLKSSETSYRKMLHRDSPIALESWEKKFDDEICPIVGFTPKNRPVFVPELESLLIHENIKAEDLRSIGGALWVYAPDINASFSAKMQSLGFKYRPNKGWWKESK